MKVAIERISLTAQRGDSTMDNVATVIRIDATCTPHVKEFSERVFGPYWLFCAGNAHYTAIRNNEDSCLIVNGRIHKYYYQQCNLDYKTLTIVI